VHRVPSFALRCAMRSLFLFYFLSCNVYVWRFITLLWKEWFCWKISKKTYIRYRYENNFVEPL